MTIKGQPNRLAADAVSFAGREIDRSKPLAFRLNGREIRGFEGDTVLSAVLATGIVQAGWRSEQPLALDDRFAPPVSPRDSAKGPKLALPMDRMPATAGLDLVSVGVKRRNPSELSAFFGALFGGRPSSLELEFGASVDINAPWTDAAPSERIETDVAIVGGGIAGIRAAIAAASTGETVTLIERRQTLGGDARFFGSIDEEEAPAKIIDGLIQRLFELKGLTTLLRADATGLYGREIRVHQVIPGDRIPSSRVVTIAARRIVLATGSFERLPVFPGNRIPRVSRAVAAFNLADRFGVWIGRRALFNTASGYAYRVAVEAQKAGVAVERIADSRLHPQSRFIDFSKAYGVPLSFGVSPHAAALARRGEIDVQLTTLSHRGEPQETAFATEQFVVCGGWQPALRLWHMAGGRSRWVAATHRMEPAGKVEGVEVVGAAAGWRSTTACLASAAAGVAILLGRRPEPVEDKLIDPMFETPDDPTPIATSSADGIAYLDAGQSLAERPASTSRAKGIRGWFSRPDPAGRFLAQSRALTVGDIAAAVQLGAIAPADAGTIAQERCVPSGDIVPLSEAPPPTGPLAKPLDAPPYPAWLTGRFGPEPRVWQVEATDRRTFETGCLVYPDADKTDPMVAVGVVLESAREGAMVLLGGQRAANDALVVRDLSGPVPVKLVERPTPGGA